MDDAVSPQDAQLALQWVAYRLRTPTAPEATDARTVGELHEQVCTAYGEEGWMAFVELWQEAAGIEQPARKQAAKDDTLRRLYVDHKANTAEVEANGEPFTVPPDTPPRIAAFFRHTPKPSPPWRRQETVGERELRAQAEQDGAWCG